jgi:hypothetical protein
MYAKMLKCLQVTFFAMETSKHYIFRVCVAFVTQPAMDMPRNMLSSVARLAAPHFSTLSHK